MAEEKLSAIVGAKISEFKRKMAEVKAIAKTIPNKIVVNVEARTNKAQERLDRIARTINSIQTVTSNMTIGSLMAISPAAIPILAAAVASLAMLGPMAGVVAGSTFALATALGFAGVAAVAFAGAAIPTITKLFDDTTKLTKAQQTARKEFDNVGKTWKSISKDLEKPVLQAFTESMRITNKMLKMAKPLFTSAAEAVNNLLKSLNTSLDSAPVKAFFDYMNKQGGPLLEKLGKSMGNFMQGFMSMMVAFGPLAESTAQGFLKMSQNFVQWAAGLSKSEKFQSFIKYVQENMPKVRAIFRDATAGIIYMFSAFGPLAADMMTGLQGLMARFKEWSSTLSENQSFQKFIGYIQQNGPKVTALIGNLTDLLVNLAIGMAPLGSAILDIVNKFLSLTNSMMSAHPWIGQMVGGFIIFIGIIRMFVPLIVVTRTLFSGLGKTILDNIKKLLPVFGMFKSNMILGLKMMGQSIKTFAITVATGTTKVISSLGKVIAKAAVASAKFIAFIIKMAGRYAWLGVQALIHAARIAAAWFIAMGPVGWVIATVIALVILIIANWEKVKSVTISIFGAVWSFLKSTWDKVKNVIRVGAVACYQIISSKFKEILSFVKGLGSSFLAAGKGLIDQMAKGIQNAASKVYNAVKGVAQKVRDFLPFSPAKIGPLSDIGRLNFGGPIKDSILRAKSVVQSALGNLLKVPDISLNPVLAGNVQQPMKTSTPVKYDTRQHNKRNEQSDPEIHVHNEWNGEQVVSYVERKGAKRARITDGFGGK